LILVLLTPSNLEAFKILIDNAEAEDIFQQSSCVGPAVVGLCIEHDRKDMLNYILNKKYDWKLNDMTSKEEISLHYLIKNLRCDKILPKIFETDLNLFITDIYGNTPLHVAVQYKNELAIRLMVSKPSAAPLLTCRNVLGNKNFPEISNSIFRRNSSHDIISLQTPTRPHLSFRKTDTR
jgi:hypothetical protein